VLSNQPERTRIRHGKRVRVVPDEPARWLSLPAEVRKFDLLIWGGGHMLQDRSSQLYIPYVVKTLLLARFLGVPRFIYAPGLGPVVNQFGRFLSRLALKGCRGTVVRDTGSADFLESIGIRQGVSQTADPGFSLRTPADDGSRRRFAESGERNADHRFRAPQAVLPQGQRAADELAVGFAEPTEPSFRIFSRRRRRSAGSSH